WSWYEPGSRPRPAGTPRPRCCCCARPNGWSGSTSAWPAPPTWRPWRRRCSPAGWPARVATPWMWPAPRPPGRPRPPDLLLDGLAALYNQGYAAAVPLLRQALAAADSATPSDEEPHWLWLACVAASHVWDDERGELLSRRYIQLVRKMG